MQRSSVLILISIFILCAFSIAQADIIDDINNAIKENGYNWVAADNEAAKLNRELGWYTPGPLVSYDLDQDMESFEGGEAIDLPLKLDWRDYQGENWVTPIRNQGQCGSCWAFATLGPMESAIAYAEGWATPLLNLSEQQLVSCSTAGNCEMGGLTTSSFTYAKKTGITFEDCFPYRQRDASGGETCDKMCDDWHDNIFKIDSWQTISLTGFNIDKMKQALQEGPIAASLIIYNDFMYYESGIYQNTTWLPQGMHAVTIIGYDETSDPGHWIAKNSWGTGWGDKGYFKIKYGVALIGSMSILPKYTSQNLGPWPDDDDDAADDDDSNEDGDGDDDDTDGDQAPPSDSDGSGDDDDGSCCG